GLYSAANEINGTSVGVFGRLPAADKVAGKTGTAENPQGPDHSWFVGYAPYNDPKIVVAVVVEHGGQGANPAAPVVCKTFAARRRGRRAGLVLPPPDRVHGAGPGRAGGRAAGRCRTPRRRVLDALGRPHRGGRHGVRARLVDPRVQPLDLAGRVPAPTLGAGEG